jgi:hypothetical protein
MREKVRDDLTRERRAIERFKLLDDQDCEGASTSQQ